MTLKEALKQLESLGNETVRARNIRNGAGENQFGVMSGDLRKLAKTIKRDHTLALGLWKTGNMDAQMLATLIAQPAKFSADELDAMVRSVKTNGSAMFVPAADWLLSNVVALHAEKESLRVKWMTDKHPIAARAGWRLTADRVEEEALDGLDLASLLDRIESEMGKAPPEIQWTMNFTLAQIGIRFPKLRKRALAIGEKLQVFHDYPVSKGCTSPFAPIWINAMVKRAKG